MTEDTDLSEPVDNTDWDKEEQDRLRLFGSPLRNPQHEHYARLRALEGKSVGAAYETAIQASRNVAYKNRYSAKSAAKNNGYRVENRPEVKERIEQLKRLLLQRSITTTVVTRHYVEDGLIEIANRCMGIEAVVDRDGIQMTTSLDTIQENDHRVGLFKSDYSNGVKALVAFARMRGWHEAPPQPLDETPENPDNLIQNMKTKIARLEELKREIKKKESV
jgi:hypothetical protein